MTAQDRFTAIMGFIAVVAAITGWFLKRLIARYDALIAAGQTISPMSARLERVEKALESITQVIGSLSEAQARHEGFHDSHPIPTTPAPPTNSGSVS